MQALRVTIWDNWDTFAARFLVDKSIPLRTTLRLILCVLCGSVLQFLGTIRSALRPGGAVFQSEAGGP